jgi:hypothetical protein
LDELSAADVAPTVGRGVGWFYKNARPAAGPASENKKAARFPGRPLAIKKATGASRLLLLLGGDFLHSLFRGGFLDGFLNDFFGFGHGMWMFLVLVFTPGENPRALGALCAAQRQHQ